MVKPVERQGRQRFPGRQRFHEPVGRATKQIQRMTVMIPASMLDEKFFESFRTFPVGRQQALCGRDSVWLNMNERWSGIPICAAGGIRHEQLGLRRRTHIGKIRIREIAVFSHVEPFPRMRQGRVGRMATDFEQLLLRGKHQRDRPMPLHE